MIKTLQKKFVITAMIAVTMLILLMLGAINTANIVMVSNGVDQTLRVISENESDPRNIVPPMELSPPGISMSNPKNDYNTFLSSNFFVVRFDSNGDIVYIDISRSSTVTEDDAKKLAFEIYSNSKTEGKTGKFRYLLQNTRMGNGRFIVFLDTSNEIVSNIRVLFLSVAIGIACWVLMLVFVILLSKKAILPIAGNIEKQKQFITNAGHEIKTPLAIIQSNTEAMELYIGANKWSKNIKEQTVRLSGLMKNLLMLARMDEGVIQTTPVNFSISELLTETVQIFVQPIEMKNITLQSEIQPEVSLHADKNHIEQLISILLDNAVKYTNDGGGIWISLQKNEKRIKLQIQNTCENLPSAEPDKLFDRFYRADTARTQKSGGYGIGLSVAQSIVAVNKGTISAEYAQPNRIIFTIRF